jgi:MMP alpha-(1->4)-mannosyltransferase
MKVCFLLHQGKMHSGGQGVYLYNVTKEVAALGHEVHVLAGPPYPEIDDAISIDRIDDFNLFDQLPTPRPEFFHCRHPREFFRPLNFYEILTQRYGQFSVMTAFSMRAFDRLRQLQPERGFDIVHDVQVLGYGVMLMKMRGMPVVSNIHHPLALDRRNAVMQAKTLREKVRWLIFYPFFMQNIVMKRVDRIITGSEHSARSIGRVFDVPASHVEIIHDGVDTQTFRPLEDVQKEPNRILFVGNSEDRNKGARYLIEALHILHRDLDFHLTLVDRPREELELVTSLVKRWGLQSRVRFTGRVSTEELVRLYNSAEILLSPTGRRAGWRRRATRQPSPTAYDASCPTPICGREWVRRVASEWWSASRGVRRLARRWPCTRKCSRDRAGALFLRGRLQRRRDEGAADPESHVQGAQEPHDYRHRQSPVALA